MRPEEYISAVTDQIRCRQAHELVREELEAHIQDQAKAYEEEGMFEDDALKKAVCEMGDPVETGAALDRIHRPQMSVGMLVLAALAGLISIAVHAALAPYGAEEVSSGWPYLTRHIEFIVLGYLMMLAVYRIDYSILGRWAKQAAGAFLILLLVGGRLFGVWVNQVHLYIILGHLKIYVPIAAYLYLPLYAAVLYQYRGSGYRGLGKIALWTIASLLVMRLVPAYSFIAGIGLACVLIFSIAVWHGWYRVNKKATLIVTWLTALLLPVLTISLSGLADYQKQRLQAFLSSGATGQNSYAANTAADFLRNSRAVGGSVNLPELAKRLPGFNSDYIFVSLIVSCGLLAGFVAAAVLTVLIVKIFRISFRQKNQLGMIIGSSCGVILLLQFSMSLAVNLNLIPQTAVILPFFSSGGSCILVSYILLGLVMSVYRYKNILPERRPENIRQRA